MKETKPMEYFESCGQELFHRGNIARDEVIEATLSNDAKKFEKSLKKLSMLNTAHSLCQQTIMRDAERKASAEAQAKRLEEEKVRAEAEAKEIEEQTA